MTYIVSEKKFALPIRDGGPSKDGSLPIDGSLPRIGSPPVSCPPVGNSLGDGAREFVNV